MSSSTIPRVSILLPAYNAEQTIGEAIDSLRAQTYTGIEIIVVDDGSEDRTLRILEEASIDDPRIRAMSIPHSGLIGALNAGLAECRGEYVARFDADDRAIPTRIERQVAFLDQNPEIDVVGSKIRCFPNELVGEGFRVYETWINSLITAEDISREIYIESPLVHPSVTIRRKVLVDIGGYEEHGWPEDYDLWLRLHTCGSRFAKIPDVLHEWRESETRLTRADSRYSVENFIRAKVHYIMKGPLSDRRDVIVWGAGQMGRRISKHLIREDASIHAYVDIDRKKIGSTRRGAPIIAPEDLPAKMAEFDHPWILAAVPSRGARKLIRENLNGMGWVEGCDYICVA
jgi:glycosyltransferase involved in cell wall biosynthesis